jgi:hypothetical protein
VRLPGAALIGDQTHGAAKKQDAEVQRQIRRSRPISKGNKESWSG